MKQKHSGKFVVSIIPKLYPGFHIEILNKNQFIEMASLFHYARGSLCCFESLIHLVECFLFADAVSLCNLA